MNKPKLVLMDIDGTIVNEARYMAPRTMELFYRMHDAGILLGIASGRPVSDLSQLYDTWGLKLHFDLEIGMNGGELKDNLNGKLYEFDKMKREWIKETFELMKPFKTNAFLYYPTYVLSEYDDPRTHLTSQRGGKEIRLIKDKAELWAEENFKILYRFDDDNEVKKADAFLEGKEFANYKAFKTQSWLYEFSAKTIDKRNAMKKFCEVHDIALSDVWAFGDMTNDNGMLEDAGYGVCMANGTPDTKAVADVITELDYEHEGFADFVEKKLIPLL